MYDLIAYAITNQLVKLIGNLIYYSNKKQFIESVVNQINLNQRSIKKMRHKISNLTYKVIYEDNQHYLTIDPKNFYCLMEKYDEGNIIFKNPSLFKIIDIYFDWLTYI